MKKLEVVLYIFLISLLAFLNKKEYIDEVSPEQTMATGLPDLFKTTDKTQWGIELLKLNITNEL